jgi:hypothetical protein
MRKLALLFFASTSTLLLAAAGTANAQDPATPGAVPPGYPGAAPAGNGAPATGTTDGSGSAAAQADIDKAKQEDSGLGLEWVYANADIGASYVDMKSFSESQLAVVDSKSGGLAWGVGAGVRLFILTIGVRVRNHTGLGLWQVMGEVGLHPLRAHFDPYFVLRGGYDTVGTLSQSVDVATMGGSTVSTNGDVQVHGGNGGLALGFDYYLASLISLGAEASGDVLFLSRPAAPLPALTAQQQAALNADPQAQMAYQQAQQLHSQSGSSVGFGATFTAHVGIHF